MSQHQPPTPAFNNLPPEEGLTIESTCGRPGCTHIYRHDGRNPFTDLSVLMKAHRPHCVGVAFAATHHCGIRWTPTPQMVRQFPRATYDPERSYFGPEYYMDEAIWNSPEEEEKPGGDDEVINSSYRSSAGHPEAPDADTETMALGDSRYTSAETSRSMPPYSEHAARREERVMKDIATGIPPKSAIPARPSRYTRTTMSQGKKRADMTRGSSSCERMSFAEESQIDLPWNDHGQRHDYPAMLDSFSPTDSSASASGEGPLYSSAATTSKAKKTAHSAAERKFILEKDPWTGLVDKKRVVCRGCGRTIKLDARSDYYPGLWEKHRMRCQDIRNGKALPDSMIRWGKPPRNTSESDGDSITGDPSESGSCRQSQRKLCK
ncbi:hypothetical protein B0H11DRAFT_2434417 [Mycena galericulata]|nr:hypothetical protein B0H11DRAFT_2434417 [Mycena galericulata]